MLMSATSSREKKVKYQEIIARGHGKPQKKLKGHVTYFWTNKQVIKIKCNITKPANQVQMRKI